MDLKHPTTKIPHHENETPPHSPPINLITFPNNKTHHHPPPPPPPHTAATYKECLKNHAASIGGHAVDGCGEYMPSPAYTATEPSSFTCAACGCHRNFHRCEPTTTIRTHFINFHHQQPSTTPSPPSLSPPPQPTNLLLTLSSTPDQTHTVATPGTPVAIKITGRKRFRTKFSKDQKEKMLSFAEKVGWKMQRCDDKLLSDFCNEIGIRRGVFKVWMHNNKNTLAKKEKNTITGATTIATVNTAVDAALVRSDDSTHHQDHGSSSSS
ncbi:hypothetical protein QVD17_03540 [Tagetes erecta]|uniref:ZF-HD dimerization-type domain-containing protein n=1 Tax=Tagetes erecta TaxID=13708 RepID=A0AAD8LFW9_TARER|nr:hypothetical protein QVD17_03540 [Tagetes erecta]